MTNQGYISIFGGSLLQPIADLIDRLFSAPHPGANARQTGSRENGYSVSICLLLAVFLESFIRRATHLSGDSLHPSEKRFTLTFLAKRYPGCDLLPAITEIFVLRDVIAHNHLWKIEYSTDLQSWGTILSTALDSSSGDSKSKNSIDLQTGTTKVLDAVLKTLEFIDQRENNRLGVVGLRADFNGKLDLTLWEIRDQLKSHV